MSNFSGLDKLNNVEICLELNEVYYIMLRPLIYFKHFANFKFHTDKIQGYGKIILLYLEKDSLKTKFTNNLLAFSWIKLKMFGCYCTNLGINSKSHIKAQHTRYKKLLGNIS